MMGVHKVWFTFLFSGLIFSIFSFSLLISQLFSTSNVRRVRSKKRNDGGALGVVYAPLVSVMHAGFPALCRNMLGLNAQNYIELHFITLLAL